MIPIPIRPTVARAPRVALPSLGNVVLVGSEAAGESALTRRIRQELGGVAAAPGGGAPPAGDLRFWVVPWRSAGRTRQLVHQLARAYGGHPLWRWWTLHQIVIPAGVAEYDDEGAARAIHAWWRDSIRFQPEPGEQVQTPGTTVAWGYGDCEDISAGIGACLESIGVGWDTELLGDPAFHIWPQALVGGRRLHLEATHRAARFGEHPLDVIRRVGRVGF